MMPWWSWVLIWTGLVLVLLVVLALCAVSLYRKVMALLAEFETLQQLLDEQAAVAEALVAPVPDPESAILRGAAAVERERRLVREDIDERKHARHEARLARGRALIKADPMQYAHLARK